MYKLRIIVFLSPKLLVHKSAPILKRGVQIKTSLYPRPSSDLLSSQYTQSPFHKEYSMVTVICLENNITDLSYCEMRRMSNVHYIPLRSQGSYAAHLYEIHPSILQPFLCASLHHCKSISLHSSGPQGVAPKAAASEPLENLLKFSTDVLNQKYQQGSEICGLATPPGDSGA